MNILIVEDDKYLSQKICDTFCQKAVINQVKALHSYNEFLYESTLDKYDVVILDIMLWEWDDKWWFKILQHIRNKNTQLPVVIMSSISEYCFLEEAFSLWAHDYLIKPFRVRELEIRVQRWFNTYLFCECYNHEQVLVYHELSYYPDKNTFYVWKSELSLCRSSKYLLSLLLINREKLLSQAFLTEKIWWDIDLMAHKNLRIKIFRLKKELAKIGLQDWIKTIRGEWYMLKKD